MNNKVEKESCINCKYLNKPNIKKNSYRCKLNDLKIENVNHRCENYKYRGFDAYCVKCGSDMLAYPISLHIYEYFCVRCNKKIVFFMPLTDNEKFEKIEES